jgi:uncharacterized protein (DUF4213/DUF364 family)
MSVIEALLATLPPGRVEAVCIGAFWTAVVVETNGTRQCGLAATHYPDARHDSDAPAVRDAGTLLERDARALAERARSTSLMEVALGLATINALLPKHPYAWTNVNAEEVIARDGAGKRVVVVGHFPFVSRLRERVGTLWVLEQQPRPGDLPSHQAARVIPQADVLAISGTTLINHTFDALMALRRPETRVLVVGPSTPLSPVLFDVGVHFLSGAIVENIEAVMRGVSQGATFRQLHRLGVRLVTLERMPD